METKLNLGCGTDIRDGYHNVDSVAVDGIDEQVDLNDMPWPDDWAGAFEYILASHVFEHLDDVDAVLDECHRVLSLGGRLDIRLPIGMNYRSDSTHLHEWVWKTPENKLSNHWEANPAFSLAFRDVELYPRAPEGLRLLQSAKFRALMQLYGPGEWCFDVPGPRFGPYGGTFRVVLNRE